MSERFNANGSGPRLIVRPSRLSGTPSVRPNHDAESLTWKPLCIRQQTSFSVYNNTTHDLAGCCCIWYGTKHTQVSYAGTLNYRSIPYRTAIISNIH